MSVEIVGASAGGVVVVSDGVEVVVSADVDVLVVSAVVDVAVDVVSTGVVDVGAVSVLLDDDTVAVVSVDPELDVPASPVSPNAAAARKPATHRAANATAIHDFFCGPPFFASGAIFLPLPMRYAEPTGAGLAQPQPCEARAASPLAEPSSCRSVVFVASPLASLGTPSTLTEHARCCS